MAYSMSPWVLLSWCQVVHERSGLQEEWCALGGVTRQPAACTYMCGVLRWNRPAWHMCIMTPRHWNWIVDRYSFTNQNMVKNFLKNVSMYTLFNWIPLPCTVYMTDFMLLPLRLSVRNVSGICRLLDLTTGLVNFLIQFEKCQFVWYL